MLSKRIDNVKPRGTIPPGMDALDVVVLVLGLVNLFVVVLLLLGLRAIAAQLAPLLEKAQSLLGGGTGGGLNIRSALDQVGGQVISKIGAGILGNFGGGTK